jgi:multidrug efflux pump subunit AcrA (membrane-fusion protein)
VLENGAPAERRIETGERSSTHIEVRSGLETGEEVIVIEISSTAAARNANARNPLQQQGGGGNAPRGMTSAGGGGRR